MVLVPSNPVYPDLVSGLRFQAGKSSKWRPYVLRSSMAPATPIVFVVDDDISVRGALELLILSQGWQPETFASAEAFLSRARALAPCCLLLDVTLPELSGLDLQKLVMADRAELPIIFITGYGDGPMTVQAMKAGAVEFLTKPFSSEVLLRAVRQALERSAAALDRGQGSACCGTAMRHSLLASAKSWC
jgi:FixJ family two-component response regulator